MTAGSDGSRIAISGPSIEAAMTVSGIDGKRERAVMFDKVKLISRVIVGEWQKEQGKMRSKGDEG
jgi:hypothetical protein